MRTFLGKPGRLKSLQPGSRMVYTVFVVFAVAHLVSGALLYWAKTMKPAEAGHLAEIAAYYQGDESRMMYAKEFPRLLELTHQHLFSMPITFLIAAHLCFLTGWSNSVKWSLTTSAALGVLAHVAAPWLVRYGGGGWAWLYAVSGVLMLTALTAMLVGSVWVMWAGQEAGGAE